MGAAPAKVETIAIVGAGSIGVAWAILFASAGFRVKLQDTDAARLAMAKGEIAARLEDLKAAGLVDEPPAAVTARVESVRDLAAALSGAVHVQECVPEDLALKRRLFAELDRLAGPATVLASSSSFLPASAFAEHLPGRLRCLVVHPGNPPYLLKVAELVPAPFTGTEFVERTAVLLRAAGTTPVTLAREI